jgi:hypothetical protein
MNRDEMVSTKDLKTFTVGIDRTLDNTLEELKHVFGKTSKAEIFRMGIALLKVAATAKEKDQKLAVADQDDLIVKEIVLP